MINFPWLRGFAAILRLCRLAVLLCLVCGAGCRPAATPRQVAATGPNILLIVIDTLRADHLGAYGYERDTSPFLDSLAEEGVLFEQAYSSSSYTRESVGTILTGMLPSRSGIVGWSAKPPENCDTICRIFQDNRYRTGFFTATLMLEDSTWTQGCQSIVHLIDEPFTSGYSDKLADEVIGFVDQGGTEPWFAYAHFFDPHGPYNPPSEYLAKFTDNPHPDPIALYYDVKKRCPELVKEGFGPGNPLFDDMVTRYDAEIAWIDESLKRLFAELEQRGELEDSIVVITSDHGEEFLDHGYVEHAYDLYEEGIHVPLIIWAPGMLKPERIETPVSAADIFPTLTALTGADGPSGPIDGVSLLEQDETGEWVSARPPDRPVLTEVLIQTRGIMRAVRLGDWKLIAAQQWLTPEERAAVIGRQYDVMHEVASGKRPTVNPWGEPVRTELYNLAEDPDETVNRIDEEKEIAEELSGILEDYRLEVAPEGGEAAPTSERLSPEEYDALRSTGYL